MEWTMASVFWMGWTGGTAVGLIVGLLAGCYIEWRAWYERGKVPKWNGTWKP